MVETEQDGKRINIKVSNLPAALSRACSRGCIRRLSGDSVFGKMFLFLRR
jgi:hypothetical protein